MEQDFAVVVMRTQPFHNGHKELIEFAYTVAPRVIVLVGSSYRSRDPKNPFTHEERIEMIRGGVIVSEHRLLIAPVIDFPYDDTAWSINAARVVDGIASQYPLQIGLDKPRIKLVGHTRPDTTWMNTAFPQWGAHVEAPAFANDISATELRDAMFEESSDQRVWRTTTPQSTQDVIDNLAMTKPEVLAALINEDRFNKKYEEDHLPKNAPKEHYYTAYCADSVVLQSGHVLLVRRRTMPGKGLWAMPGGHVNRNERAIDAAMRELREETLIKVPKDTLRSLIRDERTFDHPHRSLRCRVVTQAYMIKLRDENPLTKVKAADDAEKVKWVPIAELDPEVMFEDHYSIIRTMLARLRD